jgi:hypothetical protein
MGQNAGIARAQRRCAAVAVDLEVARGGIRADGVLVA